jgi:hypothetical protein
MTEQQEKPKQQYSPLLEFTYIGKIIDVNNKGKTFTVRFPQYYKKQCDFTYGKDYPEILIKQPEIDDYVEYTYLIILKDKVFINTYFRSNPRKFIDNIVIKLVKPYNQNIAKEEYKKQLQPEYIILNTSHLKNDLFNDIQ